MIGQSDLLNSNENHVRDIINLFHFLSDSHYAILSIFENFANNLQKYAILASASLVSDHAKKGSVKLESFRIFVYWNADHDWSKLFWDVENSEFSEENSLKTCYSYSYAQFLPV